MTEDGSGEMSLIEAQRLRLSAVEGIRGVSWNISLMANNNYKMFFDLCSLRMIEETQCVNH